MPRFKITVARSATKELEVLPAPIVGKILRSIESLSDVPFPKGCKKLQGHKNRWRIRIGDYRIIYTVFSAELTIDIVRIRHRKEAYN